MTRPRSPQFSHAEVMAAIRRRHEWVMAELHRRNRIMLLVVATCSVLGVACAFVTRNPWSLTLTSPGAVAIAWYAWYPPPRLERQWDLDHAAIGQHLQREGLSR